MHSTDWKRPPVAEVVLGLQFEPIPSLRNGHLGWFWRELLGKYPTASDVPPIEQERYEIAEPIGRITFKAVKGEARLRMISNDQSRMVQVQNGWLLANWLKKPGLPYPGYRGVREEFASTLGLFRDFLQREDIGPIRPNLWEVTYIDHIRRGTVWNRPDDLPNVLPGLLGPSLSPRGVFEGIEGQWIFRITSGRPGRLVVALTSGRSTADPSEEILVVRSTARGPIDDSDEILDALNCGADAAVDTFMGLVSEEAKAYWKG